MKIQNKKNKISRNSLCPCGSGKKYKKCCLNRTNKETIINIGITKIKTLLEENPKEWGNATYTLAINEKLLSSNMATSDDIVILRDGFNIDSISFSEKRKIIKKISSYDLNKTEMSIIKQDFAQLIKGEIKTWCPLVLNKIYRVRKNNTDTKNGNLIDFSNITELKYPPVNYVNHMGRLNDIGESIFYASPRYDVAINECNINNNDFFTLSEYELKDKNKHIHFCTLGINKEIYKSNFPISINTYEDQRFINELENIEHNGIQKFLFDEFTKIVLKNEEYKYKTTIALASIYLENKNTGIVYPSIACNCKGINIAFLPKVFDDNLVAIKCWLCQKKSNKILFLKESTSIDNKTGKIVWNF